MKISFVMPVYNCQSTVAKAIQSLIDQKHKDKEIIVIDDASTDYTDRICRAFNGKITYIDRDKRGGASVCRNIGNELASGDIIAVCDADYYFPERGDAIDKFFTRFPKKDIFYSGLYLKDARSGDMVQQDAYEWDFNSKCPIPHATVAYRAKVSLECKYHEDSMETDLYEFMLLDAHKKGYNFGGCQNPLMIKTEGNSVRDVTGAKALKKEKYKEYGI
jgi:glycosyltransferase involved in cell wall biosynthesis